MQNTWIMRRWLRGLNLGAKNLKYVGNTTPMMHIIQARILLGLQAEKKS
jgi:hypothetical protein